jgi:glycerol-1-phosphatase
VTHETAAGPLHGRYDVALLDLDGVVYIGGKAVPGAPEALRALAADGMRLAYVTNNAYRTPAAVAALLNHLGAPARASDVVTSAQAAARLLADKLPAGAKVLVIGGTGLRLAIRERGLVPVSVATERPQAVVEGYAPGVNYDALAEGGLAVAAGAMFVGTNADSTLPGPRGRQPGNGSMLRVIRHATGAEPVIAGKPEPPLHRESVLRTGARHPLVVGDRLDTDIEGAHRVGADSLLVLTGVTRPADLVVAPPEHRPTYVTAGLQGLLEPYRAAEPADGGFRCAGWVATAAANAATAGSTLSLEGTGDPVAGLRALCAAAWTADHLTQEAAREPLSRLAEAGLKL